MPANKSLEELRQARGNRCEICDCTQEEAKARYHNGLEFAHLKTTGVNGRGRGMQKRYWNIKKYPERYKLVCRWCHRIIDKGTH